MHQGRLPIFLPHQQEWRWPLPCDSLEWHTCGPFNRAGVKREWVAEKAKELLTERQGLAPRDLVATLREKHGVEVKPRAATKAVAKARKMHDDEDASFDKLPGLFHALKEQNPRNGRGDRD